MSDIIDKLNRVRWQLDQSVAHEARDEIIRLRVERDHAIVRANLHGGRYWEGRYRDEAAENKRLRAALEGVVREWEEAKAGQQLPMSVPYVVAVTMAGIARAALEDCP